MGKSYPIAVSIVVTKLNSEHREIHTAVRPVLHKITVSAEVIVLSVFKNEHSTLGKQSLAENEIGDLRQFLKRIRRVGKDEIKLLATRLQEAEHITAHRHAPVGAEFLETL